MKLSTTNKEKRNNFPANFIIKSPRASRRIRPACKFTKNIKKRSSKYSNDIRFVFVVVVGKLCTGSEKQEIVHSS